MINQYFEDYDKFIFRAPTAELEPLAWDELGKAAADANESASGPRQWGAGDLKKRSAKAFERLEEMMMNAVEG